MAPPAVRPHTDAIVARLVAGGVQAGNHAAPDGDPPYVAVYLLAGGEADGPTAQPDNNAQFVWQITGTGTVAEQSQWISDRARALLSGWRPTVSGRSVMPLQLQQASAGTFRDDDLPTPLYSTFDRYEAWSFPA